MSGKARSVLHGDVGVGVAGVTHHANANVAASDFIQSTTLLLEDLTVSRQKVRAVHARATRTSAHQEDAFGVLEEGLFICASGHFSQERESAVAQFHHDAL